MFDVACKVFFCGLLLALVVHPHLGLAVMGLACVALLWRVWAFFALPMLWAGTESLKAWAKVKAPDAQS